MRNTFLTVQQAGGMTIIVLTGLIVAGYGAFALWKPELVWKWQHMGRRWMYQDAKPTYDALTWMRIWGGFTIIASLFFVLFMLWKVTAK